MIIELALALAAITVSNEELRQQVVCAESGFSDAAEQKDVEAFASFIDPDARFVAGRVSRGREAVVQAWSGLFESEDRSMRWRPKVVEVTEDGTLAISRGPYRSRRTGDDGRLIETWGSFVSTWRRNDDGDWKVVFDTEGYSGPEPSESDKDLLESDPECRKTE